MSSMLLDVCKILIDYIRKLWISRGGGPIEIGGGYYIHIWFSMYISLNDPILIHTYFYMVQCVCVHVRPGDGIALIVFFVEDSSSYSPVTHDYKCWWVTHDSYCSGSVLKMRTRTVYSCWRLIYFLIQVICRGPSGRRINTPWLCGSTSLCAMSKYISN